MKFFVVSLIAILLTSGCTSNPVQNASREKDQTRKPAQASMDVKNNALGFTATQSVGRGGDSLKICDSRNQCFSFVSAGDLPNRIVEYKEENGRCDLTFQTFETSFRTGNTRNEFMLDLLVFVVKVTRGEESCQLGARSLTGIYSN